MPRDKTLKQHYTKGSLTAKSRLHYGYTQPFSTAGRTRNRLANVSQKTSGGIAMR